MSVGLSKRREGAERRPREEGDLKGRRKKEKAEDAGIHVTWKKIRGPWEGRRDQRGGLGDGRGRSHDE